MTTAVEIINRGPNRVKVEVQSKDEQGRFAAKSEHILQPNTIHQQALHVHGHQSLQIIELKDEEA